MLLCHLSLLHFTFLKFTKERRKEKKKICFCSGKGPFFSSGNDLMNFAPMVFNPTPESIRELAMSSKTFLESFVASFIDFRGKKSNQITSSKYWEFLSQNCVFVLICFFERCWKIKGSSWGSIPLQTPSKKLGNGRFFSSGGDLWIYRPMILSYCPPKIDLDVALFYLQHIQNFVSAFINFQGKNNFSAVNS